jgi:hypothetical protein
VIIISLMPAAYHAWKSRGRRSSGREASSAS